VPAPAPLPVPVPVPVAGAPVRYTQKDGDKRTLILLRTPFFAALVRRSLRDFGQCLALLRAKYASRVLPLTAYHMDGTLHQHIAAAQGVVANVFTGLPEQTATALNKVKRCTTVLDAAMLFFQLFGTTDLPDTERDNGPIWLCEAQFGVDDEVERLRLAYRELQPPNATWTVHDTLTECRKAVAAAAPPPPPPPVEKKKKAPASEWAEDGEEEGNGEDAMDVDEPAPPPPAPPVPPVRNVAPVLPAELPPAFNVQRFAEFVLETRRYKRLAKYRPYICTFAGTLLSMREPPTQREMERALHEFLALYKTVEQHTHSDLTVPEMMLAMHHVIRAATPAPPDEPSFSLNAMTVDM
jgi:hypothetical protein